MANSKQYIIIQNLNQLIDASGLSDLSFSNMLEISIRKLRYIKSGKANLKLADIEIFADFFGISTFNLSKSNIKIGTNFRNKLLEKYKNKYEYRVEFEKTPSITFAIRYYLINSPEFLTSKEVKDIRLILENIMGWKYSSPSLSNALKRMPDLIKIEPHPTKKGTFVYSKK